MKYSIAVSIVSLAMCQFACFDFVFDEPGPPTNPKCAALQGVSRFTLMKLDQSGSLLWQKSFGSPSFDTQILVRATTGGYVAAFTSQDSQTSIAFFDESGNLNSQKVIAGAAAGAASADVRSLELTSDGGFVIAGSKFVLGNSVSGNSDFWILKLDKSGNRQWEKTLGGSEVESAYSIHQTSDLGYVVAGFTSSNNGDVDNLIGGSDYWIIKLTQSGSVEWKKTFGGCGADRAHSVRQTKDAGYIVAGFVDADACAGQRYIQWDYGIVKLNQSGDVQWQKNLGGSRLDWAWSIGQSLDGGYHVAGSTGSADGDVNGFHGGSGFLPSDFWAVKLDERGDLTWSQAFGGSADEEALTMLQTGDGGYIMCGNTGSNDGDVSQEDAGDANIWIVKLTESGSIQWEQSYGGPCVDKGTTIQSTSDGGYIVAGTITE